MLSKIHHCYLDPSVLPFLPLALPHFLGIKHKEVTISMSELFSIQLIEALPARLRSLSFTGYIVIPVRYLLLLLLIWMLVWMLAFVWRLVFAWWIILTI